MNNKNNGRVRLTVVELSELTGVSRGHVRDYFNTSYRWSVTDDEVESIECALDILGNFPAKIPRRIDYKEGKSEFDEFVRAKRVWLEIVKRLIENEKEKRKLDSAAEELMRILYGPSEDETEYYGLYDAVEYGGLENYGVTEFKRRIKQRAGIV